MLEGPHINLRLLREDDLEEFINLHNRYAEQGDFPDLRFRTLAATRKEFSETGWWWDDKGWLLITDKQDRMLGAIVFFKNSPHESGYELGYFLLRRADRNRGYVSEALRIFSAYLFELKPVPRLQLVTNVDNQPARRVAEKGGYQYEGTLRKQGFVNGQYSDAVIYSLLREECPSLPEALKP